MQVAGECLVAQDGRHEQSVPPRTDARRARETGNARAVEAGRPAGGGVRDLMRLLFEAQSLARADDMDRIDHCWYDVHPMMRGIVAFKDALQRD
jgi:hypothetical protein